MRGDTRLTLAERGDQPEARRGSKPACDRSAVRPEPQRGLARTAPNRASTLLPTRRYQDRVLPARRVAVRDGRRRRRPRKLVGYRRLRTAVPANLRQCWSPKPYSST